MKQILSFLALLMSIIAITFVSSCSKETTTSIPHRDTSTTVITSSQNTYYRTANNWVKQSNRDFKCTFYGINGYVNNATANVKVYLIVQNMETIISNGSINFMNGELSAGHDAYSVWVSFSSSFFSETLPFSSLDFKIVFG